MTKHFCFHSPLTTTGLAVDAENAVVRGVAVMSCGPAKGHDLEVDRHTLEQVVECGRRARKVQVKLDHKSGVSAICGFLTNFRIEGGSARADWHLLRSHPECGVLLERAQTMPECFGLSAAFSGPERGERVGGKNYARCSELLAVDCVTNPAANPTGLFARRDEKERRSPHPAVGAAISGAVSGAVLGSLPLLRRGVSVRAGLKSIGATAAASAGIVGGGTVVGSAVLGEPRKDDPAAITKRAAVGGGLVGAAAGLAGGVVATRTKAGRALLGNLAKGWRPAAVARKGRLPAAVGIGGVAGGGIGAFQGADEGQQADSIRNIRAQAEARRPKERGFSARIDGAVHRFSDPRPRDGTGQFLPATAAAVPSPSIMRAAYAGVPAEKIARRQALLGRLKKMISPSAVSAAGGPGGARRPIAEASLAPMGGAPGRRLTFAARIVHEFTHR